MVPVMTGFAKPWSDSRACSKRSGRVMVSWSLRRHDAEAEQSGNHEDVPEVSPSGASRAALQRGNYFLGEDHLHRIAAQVYRFLSEQARQGDLGRLGPDRAADADIDMKRLLRDVRQPLGAHHQVVPRASGYPGRCADAVVTALRIPWSVDSLALAVSASHCEYTVIKARVSITGERAARPRPEYRDRQVIAEGKEPPCLPDRLRPADEIGEWCQTLRPPALPHQLRGGTGGGKRAISVPGA